MNPYFQLIQYILPEELFSHFELCRVEEVGSELHLYLYLEEKNLPPESDTDLSGHLQNSMHKHRVLQVIRKMSVPFEQNVRIFFGKGTDVFGKRYGRFWKKVRTFLEKGTDVFFICYKPCSDIYLSVSIAALHPLPAAVIA